MLEDLFYHLVGKLEAMGETDYHMFFIGGTKLESPTGRYTFVRRKSGEEYLAKGKKQVRRETGLTSPVALQSHLDDLGAGIDFVHGSGKRKSPEQKEWERLSGQGQALQERWEGYEKSLVIMGKSHNNYSKTDEDATFMRMKMDYMRNGQLKPGYNSQIAVNSEYITGIMDFPDQMDVKTLKPFLRLLEGFHRVRYEEVVADARYESLENYLYLDATGQNCFIKTTNYDQKKNEKFQKQIVRIENMTYDPEEDCFTCAQGRKLTLCRECTEEKSASLCPSPGTDVRAAPAVLAVANAAGPRTRSTPKSFACRRFLGRSVRKPHSVLPPKGASIYACAASSRWRGNLPC